MQLAPPLLGLTIKTALAADLSHVWGVRMLGDCGAYLAPKMPAVGTNIFRGAVSDSKSSDSTTETNGAVCISAMVHTWGPPRCSADIQACFCHSQSASAAVLFCEGLFLLHQVCVRLLCS